MPTELGTGLDYLGFADLSFAPSFLRGNAEMPCWGFLVEELDWKYFFIKDELLCV